MKSLCAQAGSGEKECIYGAIRDVMNNNPQDPNGKAFCEVVKPTFRAYCFFGMGTILGTQQSTPETKRAGVRAVGEGRGPRPVPDGRRRLGRYGTSNTTRSPGGVTFRIRPARILRSASGAARFARHASRLTKSANGGLSRERRKLLGVDDAPHLRVVLGEEL